MGGEHTWPGDVHGWGTCMAGGPAWLGGCPWLGDVHGCGEACMAGVARVAGDGRALLGGGHVWVKEDCARFGATPPTLRLASGRYTSYWNADMLIYDVTNEIFINVSTEFLYLTRSG